MVMAAPYTIQDHGGNLKIRVIDSHTGGEPTRLIVEGGPDLGEGPLDERLTRFRERFDAYRSAIVSEPRGSEALVGALLVKPHRADCELGVIFFNNVGFLGMCGHGTIGLVASLRDSGALSAGSFRIDTPVGPISVRLHDDGQVSVENVKSFRTVRRFEADVDGVGKIAGDVAWGGNWFFLISEHGQIIDLAHVESLTDFASRARAAVNAQGYPQVDHIEVFGPGVGAGTHSRNFVLCPGKAYDRSPCGTGTSAKLACLAADGRLREGEAWVQESVVGSTFVGHFRWSDRAKGEIIPTITGAAHVTGENTLRLEPGDPFCWGFASDGMSGLSASFFHARTQPSPHAIPPTLGDRDDFPGFQPLHKEECVCRSARGVPGSSMPRGREGSVHTRAASPCRFWRCSSAGRQSDSWSIWCSTAPSGCVAAPMACDMSARRVLMTR